MVRQAPGCHRIGEPGKRFGRIVVGGPSVCDRWLCGGRRGNTRRNRYIRGDLWSKAMALDDKTRTELEAAAFRHLLDHLRSRTDVQNIDLMSLAGFCRNCLSNWMKDAADAKGVPMTKDESREAVYGMPFEEWKAKYQREATKEQIANFEKSKPQH
jgi:hypothetical protein